MFHFGWGICFFGGVENAGAGYARSLQSFWQSLSFCTVFFDNFARICCFWHLCYIIIVNVWENVLFRAFSPVLCIGKGTMSEKEKILIADDSAMNRAILTEMLGDGYEILEAENGRQAVSIMQTNVDIDLLLLDIMMPEMDGFDVLAMMNKYHWIDDIPVIMISAENASSYVERAYDLGATDYISRPFDMAIVRRRVINTLMLYAKQKRLVRLVAEQVYEKEKSNSTMINILSHIVEFRNGESGLHVLHIQTATDILLRTLVRKNDKYNLNAADISLISTASALHDIGKINIPASILNKPGKLTKEEFDTMKAHTTTGAEILDKLPFQQESPLVKTAYAICRWHHERWDGRGYPDGLKGEDIPIAAQVVAMADVYDALTSERCYKKAFGHDKAMEMILNGECGQFNPLLLECLTDAGARLHAELSLASSGGSRRNYLAEAQHISEVLLHEKSLPGQDHILRTLFVLRTKANFFAENARCVQFDYSEATGLVRFSPWAVEHMQVPEELHLPDEADQSGFAITDIDRIRTALRATTVDRPHAELSMLLPIDGELRWHHVSLCALWSDEIPPLYIGAVGQANPV
jgi:response regulator RpfG family c-di-GMP phosphodiesterase